MMHDKARVRILTLMLSAAVLLLLGGCGKSQGPSSGGLKASKSTKSLEALDFNKTIMANQLRIRETAKRFGDLVTRYNNGDPGVLPDFEPAAQDIRNQLKDAKAEVDAMPPPTSSEAKAFHNAYQQLLENQIRFWDGDGVKLVRILKDPDKQPTEKAREFNPLLERLQKEEKADLAKVKEKQLAFLKAHKLPLN